MTEDWKDKAETCAYLLRRESYDEPAGWVMQMQREIESQRAEIEAINAEYLDGLYTARERAAEYVKALTDEEFEAEAKRRGFYLLKRAASVKFVPCICGANRRAEWYSPEGEGYFYKCEKCYLESPVGKTKKAAKENWNRMIEEMQKGKGQNND